MKIPGLELETVEEKNVIKGRQLCGGEYTASIAMYPMLTPEQYNWTLLKMFIAVILTLLTPMHTESLKWAIRTGEEIIALTNVSFLVMVLTHDGIYWLFIYHRSTVKDLFRSLGTGLFHYSTSTFTETSRFKNKATFLLRFDRYFTLALCVCYFFLVPAMNVWLTGEISTENQDGKYPYNKKLPVPLAMPFKTDTIFMFWSTFVMEFILALFAALIMSSTANIYLGFNAQTWNQLEMLKQSIGNIHERASDLYMTRTGRQVVGEIGTKEFQDCLTWCLKENVKHHIEIIKFFRKFDRLFSDWLFYEILSSNLIICLTLFLVGRVDFSLGALHWVLDVAARLMMFSFSLSHVVIYCLAGQKTSNMSHEIHEAYYYCRTWYTLGSQDFKKIISICMAMSNRPLVIRGYGIIPANAETFLNVIKSTFSLLNFVRFLVD